jgi:hypothetical protein
MPLMSTTLSGHGVAGSWFPGAAYSLGFAGRPLAPALAPSTRWSESITASTPAFSASTAMRTSARRSRADTIVQFSVSTMTRRAAEISSPAPPRA